VPGAIKVASGDERDEIYTLKSLSAPSNTA
jgi:hypothetical protein